MHRTRVPQHDFDRLAISRDVPFRLFRAALVVCGFGQNPLALADLFSLGQAQASSNAHRPMVEAIMAIAWGAQGLTATLTITAIHKCNIIMDVDSVQGIE